MINDLSPPSDLMSPLSPPSDIMPRSAAPPQDLMSPPSDLVPPGSGVPSKPVDEGYLGAIKSGIVASIRDFAQTSAAIKGSPTENQEPRTIAEQPIAWRDLLSPGTFAEKTLYGLARGFPQIVGGAAGTAGGAALGTAAVGGPEDPLAAITAPAGAAVGGFLGAGAVGAAQSLGPYYAAALKEHHGDPDAAFDAALRRASMEGAASGVSWAAFGWAPFKGAVKNMLFQAFGVQPAVAVGARAATNVAEGRPAMEGTGETIPGAIAGTIIPLGGHAIAKRFMRGARPEAEAMPASEAAARGFPQEPPPPGEAIGLNFPNAPSRRATVDRYFDNGNSVRLRFDNGEAHDYLTSEVMRDRTEPPPPLEEDHEPPPFTPGSLVGEQESFDQMTAGERLPEGAYRELHGKPADTRQGRLGPEALDALNYADSLERQAQDPMTRASHEHRLDMLTAAARLRRLYGAPEPAREFGTDTEAPTEDRRQAEAMGPLGKAMEGNVGKAPEKTAVETSQEPVQADQALEAPGRREKAPQSLLAFLKAKGGIKDEGGELGAMDAHKSRPGLVNNKTGLSLDEAREAAQEAGYLGHEDPNAPAQIGTGDLLQAIDRELRGEKVYSERDREQLERFEAQNTRENDPAYREHLFDGLKQRADRLGVSYRPDTTPQELAADVFEREAIMAERGTAEASGDEGESAAIAMANEVFPEVDWRNYGEKPEGQAGFVPGHAGEAERVRPAEAAPGEAQGAGAPRASLEGHPEAEGEGTRPRGEPKTELTEQGEQFIMPGGERSARQAAEAREAEGRGRIRKGTNEPLDYGLFAPRKTEEPTLPLEEPKGAASKEPISFGPFQDRREDFTNFVQEEFPGLKPGDEAHHAARTYVLRRGTETGNEHLVAYDEDSQRYAEAGTSNQENAVTLSNDLNQDVSDPNRNIIVHHNHLSGLPISIYDIVSLGRRGLKAIFGHNPNGDFSMARLSSAIRRQSVHLSDKALQNRLWNIVTAAHEAAAKIIDPLVKAGAMDVEQRHVLVLSAANRGLHGAGIIDYMESHDVPERFGQAFDEATRQARSAATGQAYEEGFRLGAQDDIGIDRAASSGRFEQPLARISGAGEGAPGGLGSQEKITRVLQGRAGEGAPGGTEARQEGLAQQKPRFPEQPETAPEGREYFDKVSDAIAEDQRKRGPGTYERLLQKVTATGPEKHLGGMEEYTIIPATLADIDKPFSHLWDATQAQNNTVSRLDAEAQKELRPLTRQLSPADKRTLWSILELDMLEKRVRTDDGRSLVARNEGFDQAEHSKPGDVFVGKGPVRDAYFAVRNVLDKRWDDLVDATAKKLGWNGAIDPQAIRNAAQEELARGAGRKSGAKQLNNIADIVEAMQAQKNVAYFPRMRFGDYYLAVKPKAGTDESSLGGFPETTRFELVDTREPWRMFGKQRQAGFVPDAAQARIAKLREQFPESDYDIEHDYLFPKADALRKLDIPGIEKLMTLLNSDVRGKLRAAVSNGDLTQAEADRHSEVFNEMVEHVRDAMYEELKAGFKKRAKVTPGYSGDSDRVLGAYLGWTSRHIGDLLHGDEIKAAKELMDKHPDKRVRDFADKWLEAQDRSPTTAERAATGLQRIGFLWTLAANPSSMAVVLMHGPMSGHAHLMIGNGVARSGRFLYGAMREAIGALRVDKNKGIFLSLQNLGHNPGEKALLSKMADEGVLHSNMANEFRGSGAVTKAEQVLGSTIGSTDQINRAGMALAAYRLARQPGAIEKLDKLWGNNQKWARLVERNGLTPETYSRFMVDEGLFVWGKRNRMQLGRGPVGTTFFQFKNFVVNYLSAMHKLMTRMGPEGKKSALFMLASLGAIGGLTAFPFVGDISKLVNYGWKAANGQDQDLGAKLDKLMADAGFSRAGAEAILHGAPRAFLGVDLSQRLGFGDEVSRQFGANPFQAAGAVPGMLASLYQNVPKELRQGRTTRAIADMMPALVRNQLMAYGVYPEEGVRTHPGSTVIPREQVTPQDQFLRAFGLTSSHIANAYEDRQRQAAIVKGYKERTNALYDRLSDIEVEIADAQRRGDSGTVASLNGEFNRLIKENSDLGLTSQQLREAIKRGIIERTMPEVRAMQRTPKAIRGKLGQHP